MDERNGPVNPIGRVKVESGIRAQTAGESSDMIQLSGELLQALACSGNRPATVLIVDDDEGVVWALRKVVGSMGLKPAWAPSAELALEAAQNLAPDVALLDVQLPGMDGLRALGEFRRASPATKIIMMTAHGSLDAAVTSFRLGATDYVPKPFDLERVREAIRASLSSTPPSPEVERLRGEVAPPSGLVGRSAPMQELFRQVAAVAPSDAAVLLLGESGTGKELVARAIHQNGPRADGPFEAINCAALPETLFESELYGHARGAFTGAVREKLGKLETAQGGTVFLDEIGDLPPSAQVKLLRFLEERRLCRVGGNDFVSVDVRLISATHRDLDAAVRAGRFREDLHYRLNVIRIEVPALRDRRVDIPLLLAHYLDRAGAAGISPEAVALIASHSWPGNVRELRNALERGAVLARGGLIRPEHLPDPVRLGVSAQAVDLEGELSDLAGRLVALGPPGQVLRLAEARWQPSLLRNSLAATGGNQARAAKLLGVTRTTLKRKMQLYGI